MKNHINQLPEFLTNIFFHKYWQPLYQELKKSNDLDINTPTFLLDLENIVFYLNKTHVAIEYTGNQDGILEKNSDGFHIRPKIYDYSNENCNLLEKIIGFQYDSTRPNLTVPLLPYNEDLLDPTNKGMDKILELGWNFGAQDWILSINAPIKTPIEGRFHRIINGTFFDADENGLITRRVKWLDFFPISFNEIDEESEELEFPTYILNELVKIDSKTKLTTPEELKFKQLPKINRFIEICGSKNSSEPDITSFLSKEENKFIITMKFGASDIHSEITCKWQSQKKKDIRPDFFVVQPDGYADIVEFKLPDLENNVVVGSDNREAFSHKLSSYVAQTRVYREYFDDPNNRTWFKEQYGFDVYKPKRWLVIGRRKDFTNQTWREIISDYQDLNIITFDDLIDGTTIQFYKG